MRTFLAYAWKYFFYNVFFLLLIFIVEIYVHVLDTVYRKYWLQS